MANETKVRLTHEEGQLLLRYSSQIRVPEKLGDEKFDIAERSFGDDALAALRSLLKSYSPVVQKERRACFGLASNWVQQDSNGATWKMTDPDLTIDIRFTEDAVDGVYWSLLLALHPGSPAPMAPGELSDIVWPLAKKLGLVTALRAAAKLSDPSKARKIVRDQEMGTKKE